jgi:DMSO/TMAO reductase YedYZ molybdopterin-dependent catalytic subunit
MSPSVRQGTAQSTPSPYFISRSAGSQEMSWSAAGDFAADGPVDSDRFYIHNRVHPPTVDETAYRLHVDGDAVGTPLTLSYRQILDMPRTVLDCVLDCGANGRSFFPQLPPGGKPWPLPVGFTGWQWGAMGAATWEGVSLADLLAAAHAGREGTYLTLTGLDRIPQGNDQVLPYSHVAPTSQYLSAGTLLVYRMNGSMLPIDHGFPLRAIVPGFGGNVCVKWLQSIAVTATEPTPSPLQQNQMLVGPAYPRPVAPTTQNPKSTFELAMGGTITLMPRQASVTIYGRAWSAAATIVRIEIAIEREQPDGSWRAVVDWTPVKTLTPPRKHWWVRFGYDWNVEPGSYRLYSRATDDMGQVQPPAASVVWNQHGLHWNGMAAHPITVLPMANMP